MAELCLRAGFDFECEKLFFSEKVACVGGGVGQRLWDREGRRRQDRRPYRCWFQKAAREGASVMFLLAWTGL